MLGIELHGKMTLHTCQIYHLTPNARQKLSTKRTKVHKEDVGKGMLLTYEMLFS